MLRFNKIARPAQVNKCIQIRCKSKIPEFTLEKDIEISEKIEQQIIPLESPYKPTKYANKVPSFRHLPHLYIDGNKNQPIDLHPDIFAIERPSVKKLKECVNWQELYKLVDYTHRVDRHFNFGAKGKPWRLNTGRSRRKDAKGSGSILGGSDVKAFSGPWSMFYKFPFEDQVEALKSALTVRYIQEDLSIFKDLNLSELPLKNQTDHVLTIMGDTEVPKIAASEGKYFNSLPVTGLNVLSVLKHEKLHIHVDAIPLIEKRLTSWDQRYPHVKTTFAQNNGHVEARVHNKKSKIVLDEIEAKCKNLKFTNQHDFPAYFKYGDFKLEERRIAGNR